MRPIDKILNRDTAEPPAFAVRPFGTTASEAAAAVAAADNASGAGTVTGQHSNMTSSNFGVRREGEQEL